MNQIRASCLCAKSDGILLSLFFIFKQNETNTLPGKCVQVFEIGKNVY